MGRKGPTPRYGKRRPYFKEWRKKKGYTQARLVAMLEELGGPTLPTTEASLSRIENGKQPYGEDIMEALAHIYDIEPDELFHNPLKEGHVIYFQGGDDKARQVRAIIDALTGTEG